MTRHMTALGLLLCSTLAVTNPTANPANSPAGNPANDRAQPAVESAADSGGPRADNPMLAAMQLRLGVDSLLAFMNQEPRPAGPAIARFLDEQVAPYFDFDHMARSAAGRYYQQLSAPQRDGMAEEIKRLFLTRLTQQLVSYGGQQVRYLRPRSLPGGRQVVVGMAIMQPGSYYPARIDFRLLRNAQGWTIIDVAANGQSAVVYYRKQLMRELMMRSWRQHR